MSAALAFDRVAADLGGRRVLEGFSLAVEPGEIVGLVGPNGSGKTTALRLAAGVLRPASGNVSLMGDDPRRLSPAERARRAGYLAQERIVGWNMPAWRVAALGAPARPDREAKALAEAALAETGLAGAGDRRVLEMSGGERARVLLARLLVTKAPVLLADEPAAGLDPDAAMLTLEILRRRAAAGAAVLVTLHDLTLAARGCDRLGVLAEGRLLALGPPAEALNPQTLRQAFSLDGAIAQSPFGPVLQAARSPGVSGPTAYSREW